MQSLLLKISILFNLIFIPKIFIQIFKWYKIYFDEKFKTINSIHAKKIHTIASQVRGPDPEAVDARPVPLARYP